MDIRRSTATRRNVAIKQVPVATKPVPKMKAGDGNADWLVKRGRPGAVVFIGGASLADFRLRCAQSRLRHDLLPSFWSLIGVVDSPRSMLTVPLAAWDDASGAPASNAIRRMRFQQVDDPLRYPNVGIVHFASDGERIVANVKKLMGQRSAIDLPSLLVQWLAYAWAAGDKGNPLLDGSGIPSAALVNVAFGMSGIEVTPGLTSNSSCPEAIWQSALWWHDYYEKTADLSGDSMAPERLPLPTTAREAKVIVPWGEYRLRQEAAAVTWER